MGGQGQGLGVQVTRFVRVHCTQTGHLSSHGLFLSRAAVNRHIGHAKACRSAGMGYREMDPGGGRHGRRRGRSGTCAVDPTSSARYTGRIMYNDDIDTNIFIVKHPVSGVCSLAVQWECMRIVCRRSRVRTPFASFLNPDQERYELVYTGMYWYVPVCISMIRYMQV